MASLVLGVVGSAVGPSLFGSGFTLFGATITGAQIGGALGSFIGGQIDNALFGGQHVKRQGPRLADTNIQTSTEGAPIERTFGRRRIVGQLIWATKFKETQTTTTESAGGKGIGGGSTVSTTTYKYSISIAVGLTEGVVHKLGRVWADGKILDLSQFTTRFYTGGETQTADPLIEEIEGAGNTPAYRGIAYVVFEDMPLEKFGNRIPQLQFELIRSITADDPNALENLLKGVTFIPAAGEFVYADEIVAADNGDGTTNPENAFNSDGIADAVSSLDDLDALAPNLGAVSLVTGWFGDDLRVGSIKIKPGVEIAKKTTYPQNWIVNGVSRANAHLVSKIAGKPAYGGTPSDVSVVQMIQTLKARGRRIVFYPFLFMDVPAGNTLPDPYSDNAVTAGQPAYPWRGRITVSPAPGYLGSPDKTATAATQVANFFGTATAANFAVNGTTVSWTGGDDWGLRRMVLHYAKLCLAAGGVDAFIIGSEFVGLNHVRDGATSYPSVSKLKALAADVKAIVGAGTKVGYAADWSEYNNHQTGDAPGAVLFNLDPLWADANIDFIGIDNYLPLADWRDGTAHLDYNAASGPIDGHDIAYLTGNVQGGEDYDWFYRSNADRDTQTRTPITDGLGKPWVFRAKDFWNWWSNLHYDRANGTESAVPTSWIAKSKPIWFTELGCPAVDKGANEPNVFVDPKSSESTLPYYSNGERDDLIQRRFLEAQLRFWSDNANNPASDRYAGNMVDTANIFVWTWDARPYPFFPSRSDIWADSANYELGHWLNGRLGAVLLSDLVAQLCGYIGFSACDVSNLAGIVTGFGITGTMSVRDQIDPLGVAFHFDGVETGGLIKFQMRGRPAAAVLTENDLVLTGNESGFGYSLTRAQETDLPLASRITYIDAAADYRQAEAEARRLVGGSNRVAESNLPLVMDRGQAIGIGERLLQDAWTMREKASFSLPPSRLALDPADEVEIALGGRDRRFRLTNINDTASRAVQAVATDPSIYDSLVGQGRTIGVKQNIGFAGRPLAVFMDIPVLTDSDVPQAPHVAAFADPWPGGVVIYRSLTDANYAVSVVIDKAAGIGTTLFDFYSGPTSRWDEVGALYVSLSGATPASKTDTDVLGGANAIAVQNADGGWEILQFATAELTAPGQWKLTRLLRGQRGTEDEMRDPIAAGARVVILDSALKQTDVSLNNYALPEYYKWGPQGRDISDPSYQSSLFTFAGEGLKPFSPVQLQAVFAANGIDLDLSWIRRDRSPDADAWEQTEIPMSEQTEAYDVEILDGAGAVKRTFAALSSPAATYTAAEIAADFPGGLPNPFKFTVYQNSAKVGRGTGKTAAIYFS